MRFFAGDNGNAASDAPINQMARAAMGSKAKADAMEQVSKKMENPTTHGAADEQLLLQAQERYVWNGSSMPEQRYELVLNRTVAGESCQIQGLLSRRQRKVCSALRATAATRELTTAKVPGHHPRDDARSRQEQERNV